MLFNVQNVSTAAGAAIPAFTGAFMDLRILIQRAKVSAAVSQYSIRSAQSLLIISNNNPVRIIRIPAILTIMETSVVGHRGDKGMRRYQLRWVLEQFNKFNYIFHGFHRKFNGFFVPSLLILLWARGQPLCLKCHRFWLCLHVVVPLRTHTHTHMSPFSSGVMCSSVGLLPRPESAKSSVHWSSFQPLMDSRSPQVGAKWPLTTWLPVHQSP